MPKRSPLPRLDDILEAIEGCQSIVSELDFEGYSNSFVARRPVERCVEIVSEASRHLTDELTREFPKIPRSDIRGIGNRLSHEYQREDDRIIWLVATKSFPELKPVIQSMISRLESDNRPES
jgi:uncharacterized protein with HEPN domain